MRRLPAGLAAGALLLAATACGSSGDDSSSGSTSSGGTTTVKVGLIPIVDVAPLFLGQKKGFYKKQGLKLSVSFAAGGAAIVPAVASGQNQFGFSNVFSLMVAQSNGVALKAISNGNASTGVAGKDFAATLVKKDSPIKTAKDLEGKKVAVNTLKNIAELSVRESVKKAGGDPDKLKLVEMPFDQMPAALDKGQVDAALAVEPALTTIKQQGGREIAASFVDVAPDMTVGMYFTSQQYAQKNPAVVKKFQQATAESLAYANAHPDEAREIVATYTKVPASLLAEITLPKWPAEANRASIETQAKLGEEFGFFKKSPDVDALLP
ncbi:ABC transporter substrate-binding protein [Streptomyces sp. NPDC047043]|uniref:ABC transporter substrate-binding protein n=1 Tax=Streptomyces sp. NPDC047043 TaxID=3154497 RepID=UPI0033EC2D64